MQTAVPLGCGRFVLHTFSEFPKFAPVEDLDHTKRHDLDCAPQDFRGFPDVVDNSNGKARTFEYFCQLALRRVPL